MGRRRRRAVALAFALTWVAVTAITGSRPAGAAGSPPYQFAAGSSGALPGRVFTAAAGDPGGSSVVVYGGEDPGTSTTIFGDTWVYTPATGWVAKCGSSVAGATADCGPGLRSSGAMATGPNGPILFGGSATGIDGGSSAPMSDTWVWQHDAWTQVCADGACGPTGRYFPGLGGNGSQVVMFGGLTTGGLADDTWVFDGTTWTETCGTGTPTDCGVPGRLGATIGWDGHEFVMFGGAPQAASDIGDPTDDTWTFDGTTWTQVCGTSIGHPCGPGPRALAGMALQRQSDATLQGAVLAGGGSLFGGGVQTLNRDTWLFRAGAWSELSTPWSSSQVDFTDSDNPPAGSGPLLPFVVARPLDCQILFVGENPIENPDFGVSPQTYTGGWDLAGNGEPAGCTVDPVAAAASTPVGDVTATPVSDPGGASPSAAGDAPAAAPSMARTGATSGPLAAVGLLAVAFGLAAIRAGRPRRGVADYCAPPDSIGSR